MKTRYKFLNTGLKSAHGDMKWKIGAWYKIEGKLDICKNGFHCSKEIGQAFSYVQGEILAKVEVRGKSVEQDDKDVWEEMRIIKAWNWEKKNSVAIAIYSAELCLKNFEKIFPDDKRPREAIEATKKWLENPTKENESAAWSVASAASAAWSAARSAASAAWSAASAASAAWSAAWSAASAAESAARSAAWSAASAASAERKSTLKKIYKRFDEELNKLTPYIK